MKKNKLHLRTTTTASSSSAVATASLSSSSSSYWPTFLSLIVWAGIYSNFLN